MPNKTAKKLSETFNAQKHQNCLGQGQLTEELIVRWIKATHEKTGKWPNQKTLDVWDKDPETGEFIELILESWAAIDNACRASNRGLKKFTSLARLKKKYDLNNNLTLEKIDRWIRATYKKTGKWPAPDTKDVWDYGKKPDTFVLIKKENWKRINAAFSNIGSGLKGFSSLAHFKDHHGLNTSPVLKPINHSVHAPKIIT